MRPAETDEEIQTFALYGADEGLGEGVGVRCSVRDLDDPGTFREIPAQNEATDEAANEELSRWGGLNLMDQSWCAFGEAWGSVSDGVASVAIGARNVGNNSVQTFSSGPDYLEKSTELGSAAFQYLVALIVKTLVFPMLIVGVGLWLWRIFWKPAHTVIRPAHEMRDRSPTAIE